MWSKIVTQIQQYSPEACVRKKRKKRKSLQTHHKPWLYERWEIFSNLEQQSWVWVKSRFSLLIFLLTLQNCIKNEPFFFFRNTHHIMTWWLRLYSLYNDVVDDDEKVHSLHYSSFRRTSTFHMICDYAMYVVKLKWELTTSKLSYSSLIAMTQPTSRAKYRIIHWHIFFFSISVEMPIDRQKQKKRSIILQSN